MRKDADPFPVEARRVPVGAGLGAVVAALMLAAAPAAEAGCKGAHAKPTAANQAQSAKATACLVNHARTRAGLKALDFDARLKSAATGHAEDMVRRGYFDHVSPEGETPQKRAARANYAGNRCFLAENIAWGSGRTATPAGIFKLWMKSGTHRNIILTPRLRDLGVGIAIGSPMGGRGATYTMDLGRT